MRPNVILTLGILALTLGFIGCNGSTSPSSTNKAKPANSNSAPPKSGNDTITVEEGGIMLTVPPGFTHEKEGKDVLISSPDEGVMIMLTVPADGDYSAAREDAADDLEDYIADAKIVEEDAEKKINGFDARTYSGTGKAKKTGKEVNWVLTTIKTDKKAVLVLVYAEKDSLEKHAADVAALISSIKKI